MMEFTTDDTSVGMVIFMICMWMVFALGVPIAGTWVTASAVTSGVKSLSGNCGQEYVVEVVLAGDWFCPLAKTK